VYSSVPAGWYTGRRPSTSRCWRSVAVMGSSGIGHFTGGQGAVDLGVNKRGCARSPPVANTCAPRRGLPTTCSATGLLDPTGRQSNDDNIARRAAAGHAVPVRAHR
jgi:hypothetical protein